MYLSIYIRVCEIYQAPCLLGCKYNAFTEASTLRSTHAYPDLAHPLLCSSVILILIFWKFSIPYFYLAVFAALVKWLFPSRWYFVFLYLHMQLFVYLSVLNILCPLGCQQNGFMETDVLRHIHDIWWVMNCFYGTVDRRKTSILISSLDPCQRYSALWLSNNPGAGYEPAQNMYM